MSVTADTIAKDHASLCAFIKSQADAGRSTDAIIIAQHRGLLGKIALFTILSAEDAERLSTCFDGGPWTPSQKDDLASALANKLSCSAPRVHGQRPNQKCLHFEAFLTDEDAVKMDAAKKNLTLINHILASRSVSIGCSCPSAPTLARMAAVVAACALKSCLPDSSMHDVAFAIKAAIKDAASATPYPYGHLVEYPINPAALPADMYRHAYGETHVPAPISCAELAEISAVSSRKFMRCTARGLRAPEPSAGSAPLGSAAASPSATAIMSALAQVFGVSPNAFGKSGSFEGLTINPSPRRTGGGWHASSVAASHALQNFKPRAICNGPSAPAVVGGGGGGGGGGGEDYADGEDNVTSASGIAVTTGAHVAAPCLALPAAPHAAIGESSDPLANLRAEMSEAKRTIMASHCEKVSFNPLS